MSETSTSEKPAPHPSTTIAPTAGIVKDHIYITDGGELRTIAVATHLPEAMARQGMQWRVEDFDLHKELYRGKTSLLYMATDRKSGIQVALKLYRKRKLSTLNRYQVEREIRIHIQLDHVNIIKLYAAFEDEKNVYMVQEFAGGGDLFEDLKRNGGTIKEKYTVRDIIVPFLNALQYLHGLGIIHRDIKPENILLTTQRVVKIADFGLSICYTQERPVTRAGTLDYMAPEVLICPDKRKPEENKDKTLLAYTAQVDAWAVGILCYELLVGYPPFEQESRAATYEHIMYKEPKFPSWMSDDAKKFIATALCKNAAQRPTIQELGKLALILTYAKPVEKPPEARLPQEFLVERSARSVVSPMVGPPATTLLTQGALNQGSSTGQAGSALAPVGSKRPGTMDTEETGSAPDSPRGFMSPPGAKDTTRLAKPSSGKSSNASGMVLDEDASYAITDFTAMDDANYFSVGQLAGTQSPTKQQAPMARAQSMRGTSSPLAKSRLSGVSGGGNPPPLSMPQGKVSPLVRSSAVNSNPGYATAASSDNNLAVEQSGGSYYKPQSGILSDDSQVPLARSSSMSGAANLGLSSGSITGGSKPSAGMTSRPSSGRPGAAGATAPTGQGQGQGQGGFLMERPTLDKLLSTGSQGAEDSQGEDGGSKYSKLFAKMWGGKEANKPQDALSKPGTPNSPLKSSMRNLQDLLLTDRADSIVMTDSRTGSIIGAPTMNFKKPSPAAIQARVALEAAAAAEKPDKAKESKAALLGRGAMLSEDSGGPQRMNSEVLLARVGLGTAGSARSFTSPNSPTLKKLANAPIVNKIHEYVTQNHGGELSQG